MYLSYIIVSFRLLYITDIPFPLRAGIAYPGHKIEQ